MRNRPRDEEIAAATAELRDAGRLEPLAFGGPDERLWTDCELACMAEHRLGDRTDPRLLDAARRADWEVRAASEAPVPPSRRDYEASFWLLDAGRRVGTVAVANEAWGNARIQVSSLYVFPDHRGFGHGRASLRALGAALGRRGLGYRLDTHWAWQSNVHLYLRMGLWVQMWKRELRFTWDRTSTPPIVEVDGDRATLSAEADGVRSLLIEARREGDRLIMETGVDPKGPQAWWDADSTMALHLAVRGWPLIRSPERWKKVRGSDCSHPEGLAYKIAIWEAWDRAHGWHVDTPRIPGLDYPDWATLEAEWEREYQEVMAKHIVPAE